MVNYQVAILDLSMYSNDFTTWEKHATQQNVNDKMITRHVDDDCSYNSAFFLVSLVFAIREAATSILKKLVEQFGADWAQVSISSHCRNESMMFL